MHSTGGEIASKSQVGWWQQSVYQWFCTTFQVQHFNRYQEKYYMYILLRNNIYSALNNAYNALKTCFVHFWHHRLLYPKRRTKSLIYLCTAVTNQLAFFSFSFLLLCFVLFLFFIPNSTEHSLLILLCFDSPKNTSRKCRIFTILKRDGRHFP